MSGTVAIIGVLSCCIVVLIASIVLRSCHLTALTVLIVCYREAHFDVSATVEKQCRRLSVIGSVRLWVSVWCVSRKPGEHHISVSSYAVEERTVRPKGSLCSYRQLLYARPDLHRTCLFYVARSAFLEGVGHFRQIFDREGGVAHQPLLVTDN